MEQIEIRESLNQLRLYTAAVAKFLGQNTVQSGKNSNGPFKAGCPYGAITHYTASNRAVSAQHPFGRIPVLLNRFARGGTQGVGIHFIVWDRREPGLERIRAQYPLLERVPGEVFFFGDDLAFWHAGWVNDFCYGIEIRNCGQLLRKGDVFFWGGGKNRYYGRTPIKIGRTHWEPYNRSQIEATLWIHRAMATLYPIKREWFLGHLHITSNREDPGPHFPLHEMRQYSLEQPLVSQDQVLFLREFTNDDSEPREEPMVSEAALHDGLYRNDWDGVPRLGTEPVRDDPVAAAVPGGVAEVKRLLRSVGYWPGPQNDDVIDPYYITTVETFQARWKKRLASGRFVSEFVPTGKMDPITLHKLRQFVAQLSR